MSNDNQLCLFRLLRNFQIVVCFKAGESFLPNDMQEQ